MAANNELQGIVEEMAEERGRAKNRQASRNRNLENHSGSGGLRTLLFGGIAAAVLLAVVLLLLGGGEQDQAKALSAIHERLDRMETRLDRLEASGAQRDTITKRMEDLHQAVSRLERDRPSMQKQIDRIARRVESLGDASDASAPPPKSAAGSSGSPRKHTVQKGETLFSIAQRYALSLDDLCRLNDIDRNDVIQPGQTLVLQGGR